LSKIVLDNINPHFTITHKLIDCDNNIYFQLLEKFDGDIKDFNVDILKETKFYPQMLMGLVTLINNDIHIRDVKRENILYKKLDEDVILKYIINDDEYIIKTNTIYVYTDYGQSENYITETHDDKYETNISDLHSIVQIKRGIPELFHRDISFLNEIADFRGVCGYDIPSLNQAFRHISNRDRLKDCVINVLKELKKKGITRAMLIVDNF
jgi:hypothetical protein